ncbi:MAG: hypothetical protein AB2771_08875, partial [Candidatus Thiodiazotropha endolucinida]
MFCGIETSALVDSGSNITTVCEEFYQSLSHKPELKSLSDFDLEVECAGGNMLPYTGYIEASLQVPFLPHSDIEVPVLVVPTTEYSLKV